MNVRLDEANVTLDNGADILYPLDGTFLMGGDGTSSKSTAFLVHQPPVGVRILTIRCTRQSF